jgi:hypothetical protein
MRPLKILLAFPLLLVSSSATRAQVATPAGTAPAPSQHLATPIRTVSQALDFWVTIAEGEIVGAGDAMPEDKYSFAPAGRGFTGVRSFGQQLKHLAANNYRMAAYILTQTPTPDQRAETGPDAVRSKAQIMDYVKGSFVALHAAAAAIDDKNMLEPMVAAPSDRQRTRLQLAVDAVAHSYDHYGQIVEYLRMNEIVPPASR